MDYIKNPHKSEEHVYKKGLAMSKKDDVALIYTYLQQA